MIIAAPPGVRVGHWTNVQTRTGCSVIVFPPGTVMSGEVRGGAPATREFALLEPTRTVAHVDAVCLTGGSAFGLAAADGVMDGLRSHGRGFVTPAGAVPIVVGMSIFDLAVGDATAYPGPAEGRHAYDHARDEFALGTIGAGTGATVGKWRGRDRVRNGGVGAATVRSGDVTVTAIVVVNAFGEIDDGSARAAIASGRNDGWPQDGPYGAGENTTIGVVMTNVALDKIGCLLVAQGAHDGLAHSVFPPHTTADGDAFVAASIGVVRASIDRVRAITLVATDAAVRSACR